MKIPSPEYVFVAEILQRAFPDLPADAELAIVHSNPRYIGGIGTFAHDPYRVDLQEHVINQGELSVAFTAGVYNIAGRTLVALLETKAMGGDAERSYIYTMRAEK